MTGPDAPGTESMTISCRDQWPKKTLRCQRNGARFRSRLTRNRLRAPRAG
jgi:hypothetical protein